MNFCFPFALELEVHAACREQIDVVVGLEMRRAKVKVRLLDWRVHEDVLRAAVVFDPNAVVVDRGDLVDGVAFDIRRALLLRIGRHTTDHRAVRIAAGEVDRNLRVLHQVEVESLVPAAIRLLQTHLAALLSVEEIALVEIELNRVAALIVELRVFAVRFTTNGGVLVPLDAWPNRALRRLVGDVQRDGPHAAAVVAFRELRVDLEQVFEEAVVEMAAIVLKRDDEVFLIQAGVPVEHEGVAAA